MTTAARPTFNPAKGGQTGRDLNFPTQIRSAKELVGHTRLKERSQNSKISIPNVAGRDLKSLLIEAEREYRNKKKDKFTGNLEITNLEESFEKNEQISHIEESSNISSQGKKSLSEENEEMSSDADNDELVESDDETDNEGDDDDDETAMLMMELEKIRREREEQRAIVNRERAEKERQALLTAIASGNPLLAPMAPTTESSITPDFTVKRRWDEDVVFRDQARLETKTQKRFTNDTLRSDFHRKFLTKYIH